MKNLFLKHKKSVAYKYPSKKWKCSLRNYKASPYYFVVY